MSVLDAYPSLLLDKLSTLHELGLALIFLDFATLWNIFGEEALIKESCAWCYFMCEMLSYGKANDSQCSMRAGRAGVPSGVP